MKTTADIIAVKIVMIRNVLCMSEDIGFRWQRI